jgi:adenosylcobinamide amidohydrolase
MFAELASRDEGDLELDTLIYRFERLQRAISSAAAGGGVGLRHWTVNAEVAANYEREDLVAHVAEIAATFHLTGEGVGMLTAASVRRRQRASRDGVDAEATVGLSHPTWAATESDDRAPAVGTINIVVFLPVPLSDSALVNAVVTVTEAKTQALLDASVSATGTPSDAVAIFCPVGDTADEFCGPRSLWGSRVARVVHEAVLAGALAWTP